MFPEYDKIVQTFIMHTNGQNHVEKREGERRVKDERGDR